MLSNPFPVVVFLILKYISLYYVQNSIEVILIDLYQSKLFFKRGITGALGRMLNFNNITLRFRCRRPLFASFRSLRQWLNVISVTENIHHIFSFKSKVRACNCQKEGHTGKVCRNRYFKIFQIGQGSNKVK